VVFIVGSPQDHHDKNNDFEDPDELEIVEEELLAIALGEVIGKFGHTNAPWGRAFS
jgi:hypothetical protein